MFFWRKDREVPLFKIQIYFKIRQNFKTNSRFFYGKNNLLSVALGKSTEDEPLKDLHKISALLKGQCGLMFTSENVKIVRK